MGRPKKVVKEEPAKIVDKATYYVPEQELSDVEKAALVKEAPSSPAETLEGKELPASPKVVLKNITTKELTGDGKRFASEVQQRVFDRIEKARLAKEKRKSDALKLAREASKKLDLVFIPYKDRNGEIVPALVVGVEDTRKKDKGGDVLDENNEPVMEAKLKVYVFSNIDEPRKVLHSIEEDK